MLLAMIPFPDQASTNAWKIDTLVFVFTFLTVAFSAIVFIAITFFAIKYRRGSQADRSNPIAGSLKLELTWTFIPLVLAIAMFTWAADVYFQVTTPPDGAMEITVVGRQWMWKIQHPTGQREINELHIPIGQPVRLTMTSQDVIHSFFVPAFRVKQDVVPGMYSNLWFEAKEPGTYHLFCAEYCGTEHSRMIGWVVASESWLKALWRAVASDWVSCIHSGYRSSAAFDAIQDAKPSLSQRSSHHDMVTRSPNHWCAISCATILKTSCF